MNLYPSLDRRTEKQFQNSLKKTGTMHVDKLNYAKSHFHSSLYDNSGPIATVFRGKLHDFLISQSS